MHKDLKSIYQNLLDCHIANLYSFYFKLFKYEQLAKKKMDKDITIIVNDTIDIINEAIHTSESIYNHVGSMPELSVGFLTERSVLTQGVESFISESQLIQSLMEDEDHIDQTLNLTIHCTDSLELSKEVVHLSDDQHHIQNAFRSLKYVLQ